MFLALVSALEPLAQEAPLGEEVASLLQNASPFEDFYLYSTRAARLAQGRLNQLRQESIRQALKRLTRETLPKQPEAPAAVDDAYALRSQLIHSGIPADLDIDLERSPGPYRQLFETFMPTYSTAPWRDDQLANPSFHRTCAKSRARR